VSDFLGREYNYETWTRSAQEFELFKQIAHAGEEAIDFTLPSVDGATVTLSELRGKPVVIEFGAIT
jgi:cytochrome oxidase Cu insertion factor (SCO1/SenC/PrrC family)